MHIVKHIYNSVPKPLIKMHRYQWVECFPLSVSPLTSLFRNYNVASHVLKAHNSVHLLTTSIFPYAYPPSYGALFFLLGHPVYYLGQGWLLLPSNFFFSSPSSLLFFHLSILNCLSLPLFPYSFDLSSSRSTNPSVFPSFRTSNSIFSFFINAIIVFCLYCIYLCRIFNYHPISTSLLPSLATHL